MKVTIHTELRCGVCGQMMQYHQDVKVRCVQLKCKERNKEYHAPSVELYPVNSTLSELEGATVHILADGSDKQEKPKRGRKTVKD